MNINIYKQIVSFCLLSSVFCLLGSAPAKAQQVNLSIDPPIVQVKIKSGKSIIIAYTTQNNGDPSNLQFIVRPFIPQGQLGSLSVLPSFEGPIQFNLENTDLALEKPFFFPSREKKQAVVRITVPMGIPDGDYYYIVMAETVPAFSVAGQSTGIASAAIGSPLLITVTNSGVTQAKAEVAEFSFIPHSTITFGNKSVRLVDSGKVVPIVVSVRNMGKNLIQPHGVIVDSIGTIKKTYSIIPQNILSNSQRILKVAGNDDVSNVKTTLTLSHLAVGMHRVGLEISFGEGSPIQYKDLSFLALPFRLITLTIFALLCMGGVLIVQYLKKRKHTHSKRTTAID